MRQQGNWEVVPIIYLLTLTDPNQPTKISMIWLQWNQNEQKATLKLIFIDFTLAL